MHFSYHAILSFLCSMMVITETAASWNFGFIFDNLLFAIVGKGAAHCDGVGPLFLKPHMCTYACPTSTSTNTTESNSDCNHYAGKDKESAQCRSMSSSCYSAANTTTDSQLSESRDSNSGSNSNTSNDSISVGSSNYDRMSFLPYLIAAVVATMFLGLFMWKKKREQNSKQQEQLLDDDSFHGSIAKRMSNFKAGKTATTMGEGTETSFVKSTGYALA